jgi:hypothetical protein
MRVRRIAVLFSLGGLISLLTACQEAPEGSSGEAVRGTAASSKNESVQQKTPSAELANYLPPLDGGRIEIAPPAKWRTMPRDSDYVTRFYKTDRNGLPRIEVKVEESRFGEISSVTRGNVERFAEMVAADLKAQGTKPIEPVIPLVIGEVPCARYVTSLQLNMGDKAIPAERQRLLVLNEGRLYTIDLLVLRDTLIRSRDAAYAVCSSMRFISGDVLEVDVEDAPESSDATGASSADE